mmetsp:Transcript_29875/g.54201  ORF Transcript_29875/g.54201 Transcript_29875/m.54201 type:complete len:230 (+) Transcript_29875:56-745(+)
MLCKFLFPINLTDVYSYLDQKSVQQPKHEHLHNSFSISQIHNIPSFYLYYFHNFLVSQHVRMTTDPLIIRKLMNTTNRRQRMILIINHLIRRRLDIVHSQRIHPRHHLRQRHDTSNRLNLPRHLLPHSNVSIVLRQDLQTEGNLGPGEFFVAHAVGQSDHVGHDIPQHIVELVVWCRGDNAEEASVGVAEVEGGDGRREAVVGNLLAHGGGDVLAESGGFGEGSEDGLH